MTGSRLEKPRLRDREFDVVALGDCGVDLFARVDRLPSYDEKVPADFLGAAGGGVAANFACAASTLGLRSALIATVGDDSLGEQAVASVRDCGVATRAVAVLEGVPSDFCFVALDSSGEKALTIVRTPTFFPPSEKIDLEVIAGASFLHVAPFDLAAAEVAAAHAQKADVEVSVDLEPSMVGEGLDSARALLNITNVLFLNELCLDALFEGTPVREGAARLLALGPGLVVLTRGARGASVLTEESWFDVPAYPVAVRDTTGAGDCFNAAFVACLIRGLPLPSAARFAAASGALAVTEVGARGKLPSWDEVEALVTHQHSPGAGGRSATVDDFPRGGAAGQRRVDGSVYDRTER